MKALISALALAVGSGAVFVIVSIQNNPLAFTRLDGLQHQAIVAAEAARPSTVTAAMPVPESVPESVTVWLEETRIVGRVQRAPRVVPAETEPAVVVLPAPCNDGEYRLIDETRGVRLNCNVGH